MSDKTIILCLVSAAVAAIAFAFIRRAIRYKKAIEVRAEQEFMLIVEPSAQQIYLSRFIRRGRGLFKSGKTIRVREEYYDRIRTITRIAGEKKVSLISYLDSVLQAHFDDNGEAISRLLREKADELFKENE
jgi:hypothetical protein